MTAVKCVNNKNKNNKIRIFIKRTVSLTLVKQSKMLVRQNF